MTKSNPHYEARGAAHDLFYCRDQVVLLSGPAGTGKSLAMLKKMTAVLLKYPGARGLLIRRTRESMSESILVTFENQLPPALKEEMTRNCQRKQRQSYIFPNGSELIIAGLDRADKVLSSEYDIIAISQAEQIREADFEALLTRLRGQAVPYQQIIMECNPGPAHHWLINRKDITTLDSRHKDNPRYWDGEKWTDEGEKYVNGTLQALTGVTRARLLNGLWVSSSGLVFEDFDISKYLIDVRKMEFKYIMCAVDFGYTEPTVVHWYGMDSDKRMYLLKELYRTGLLTSQIIQKIKEINLNSNFKPDIYVCDSAEPDRIQEMRLAGLNAVATKKTTIGAGIELMKQRFAIQGDGKPRFYISATYMTGEDKKLKEAFKPLNFEQEIQAYVWNERKEEPVGEDDHAMSTMRYAVVHLDKSSAIFTPSPEDLRAYEKSHAAQVQPGILYDEDTLNAELWQNV